MVQIHFRNKILPLKGLWNHSALLDSANKSMAKVIEVFESQYFIIVFLSHVLQNKRKKL